MATKQCNVHAVLVSLWTKQVQSYSQPGENLLEAVSLLRHAGPQVLVSFSWSVETVQEFGGRVLTAARLQLRRECFIFVGVMVAWPGKGSSVFVHRQVVICYNFSSCVASYVSLALSASRNENWLWFHLLKKSASCWTSVARFFLSSLGNFFQEQPTWLIRELLSGS